MAYTEIGTGYFISKLCRHLAVGESRNTAFRQYGTASVPSLPCNAHWRYISPIAGPSQVESKRRSTYILNERLLCWNASPNTSIWILSSVTISLDFKKISFVCRISSVTGSIGQCRFHPRQNMHSTKIASQRSNLSSILCSSFLFTSMCMSTLLLYANRQKSLVLPWIRTRAVLLLVQTVNTDEDRCWTKLQLLQTERLNAQGEIVDSFYSFLDSHASTTVPHCYNYSAPKIKKLEKALRDNQDSILWNGNSQWTLGREQDTRATFFVSFWLPLLQTRLDLTTHANRRT